LTADERVIKEVQRFYPSVPYIARETTEDVQIIHKSKVSRILAAEVS